MSNIHLIDNMEKVRRKIELVESLLEASCPSPPTVCFSARFALALVHFDLQGLS